MDGSLSSSVEDDKHHRRHSRKKHEKKSHKKNKKKRKSYPSSSDDDDDSRRDRKRHRSKKSKHHKKKKEKSKDAFARNYQLAEALYTLFSDHPALAEDLPILLVRLASGATLDFKGMTHPDAAAGLNTVLSILAPYGAEQCAQGTWRWQNPAGNAVARDERILVRVVRGLLDDIGITMAAIQAHEEEPSVAALPPEEKAALPSTADPPLDTATAESLVMKLLRTFGKAELAAELVGLCDVILSGEAISLEGLPDVKLKAALEEFFQGIDLEKTEMEEEDDEENIKEETSYGYCLAEESHPHQRVLVETVQTICRQQSAKLLRGPLPRPSHYNASDDEDDDGPLPEGHTRTNFASAIGPAAVDTVTAEGDREEWMLTPGKYDFLGAIKSQPLKNRQFSAKSGAHEDEPADVDPEIQAEIEALRKAHEESRGPSLMDEHQKQKARTSKSEQKNWKWDRDHDLDSGRRVDKEALNMMLGGAGKDLKSKFQSSY